MNFRWSNIYILQFLAVLNVNALKLVPADRTVIKKNGTTRTISRYYLLPYGENSTDLSRNDASFSKFLREFDSNVNKTDGSSNKKVDRYRIYIKRKLKSKSGQSRSGKTVVTKSKSVSSKNDRVEESRSASHTEHRVASKKREHGEDSSADDSSNMNSEEYFLKKKKEEITISFPELVMAQKAKGQGRGGAVLSSSFNDKRSEKTVDLTDENHAHEVETSEEFSHETVEHQGTEVTSNSSKSIGSKGKKGKKINVSIVSEGPKIARTSSNDEGQFNQMYRELNGHSSRESENNQNLGGSQNNFTLTHDADSSNGEAQSIITNKQETATDEGEGFKELLMALHESPEKFPEQANMEKGKNLSQEKQVNELFYEDEASFKNDYAGPSSSSLELDDTWSHPEDPEVNTFSSKGFITTTEDSQNIEVGSRNPLEEYFLNHQGHPDSQPKDDILDQLSASSFLFNEPYTQISKTGELLENEYPLTTNKEGPISTTSSYPDHPVTLAEISDTQDNSQLYLGTGDKKNVREWGSYLENNFEDHSKLTRNTNVNIGNDDVPIGSGKEVINDGNVPEDNIYEELAKVCPDCAKQVQAKLVLKKQPGQPVKPEEQDDLSLLQLLQDSASTEASSQVNDQKSIQEQSLSLNIQEIIQLLVNYLKQLQQNSDQEQLTPQNVQDFIQLIAHYLIQPKQQSDNEPSTPEISPDIIAFVIKYLNPQRQSNEEELTLQNKEDIIRFVTSYLNQQQIDRKPPTAQYQPNIVDFLGYYFNQQKPDEEQLSPQNKQDVIQFVINYLIQQQQRPTTPQYDQDIIQFVAKYLDGQQQTFNQDELISNNNQSIVEYAYSDPQVPQQEKEILASPSRQGPVDNFADQQLQIPEPDQAENSQRVIEYMQNLLAQKEQQRGQDQSPQLLEGLITQQQKQQQFIQEQSRSSVHNIVNFVQTPDDLQLEPDEESFASQIIQNIKAYIQQLSNTQYAANLEQSPSRNGQGFPEYIRKEVQGSPNIKPLRQKVSPVRNGEDIPGYIQSLGHRPHQQVPKSANYIQDALAPELSAGRNGQGVLGYMQNLGQQQHQQVQKSPAIPEHADGLDKFLDIILKGHVGQSTESKETLIPNIELFTLENLRKALLVLERSLRTHSDKGVLNLHLILKLILEVLTTQADLNENTSNGVPWFGQIASFVENPIRKYVYNLLREPWLQEIMLQLQNNNFNLNFLKNTQLGSFLESWRIPLQLLNANDYIHPSDYADENDDKEDYVDEIVPVAQPPTDVDVILDFLKKYMNQAQQYVQGGPYVDPLPKEVFGSIVEFLRGKGYPAHVIDSLINKLLSIFKMYTQKESISRGSSCVRQ